MLPRFHAPDLDPASPGVNLPADESHHLTKVLRLSVGDEALVFDGRGHQVLARVAAATRAAVRLTIVRPVDAAREPAIPLTLAQAVLKADAMDDVVRDATMMGATVIEPILSAHVAVKASVVERETTIERWERIALASVKQCGRATVPRIVPVRSFDEWLAAGDPGRRVMLVEPAAADARCGTLQGLATSAPASIALVVGPEGGWARDEVDRAAAAGVLLVSLGGLTLRADAAPTVALALTRFVLGDL